MNHGIPESLFTEFATAVKRKRKNNLLHRGKTNDQRPSDPFQSSRSRTSRMPQGRMGPRQGSVLVVCRYRCDWHADSSAGSPGDIDGPNDVWHVSNVF